ncbi:hypothetical protein OUZ56_016386 [Daphnia magna]|uniref:Uncharacterized protein n=1 Tax=Daphnia magna TaxID=35525 RepID=A0ABR0AQG6_9CRUS|nr:hypothetical protein OUZ56_016386 [Daphnia magna]
MVENLDCVTSQPCDDVYEETHPDWAPTIFKFMSPSATNVSRYNRVKKRLAVNEKPIKAGIKHDLFMQNFSSEATELSISDINMADVLSSTMIIDVEDQENSAKLLSQLRNLETENPVLREKNLCANKELEAAKIQFPLSICKGLPIPFHNPQRKEWLKSTFGFFCGDENPFGFTLLERHRLSEALQSRTDG